MPNWLTRLLCALGDTLTRPSDALPPDAERELEMWDAETVARYKAEHGGDAPPDAPHIDEGGI